MRKRSLSSVWARSWQRGLSALTSQTLGLAKRPASPPRRPVKAKPRVAKPRASPPLAGGDWLTGIAVGTTGARRFKLFRPPGIPLGERLPLLVMLHGCGQDASSFALSTRMNALAAKKRFLVLYPEQDRLSNLQGCWNWFDTDSGRAFAEAALIMRAVDQVCLFHPADRDKVAIAGLSSGASMAALVATRYPTRFKAVVMHSGIPHGSAHSGLSALGAMHGYRRHQPAPLAAFKRPKAWPPLLVIQGNADTVVTASNGAAAARQWAMALGARPQTGRTLQRGRRYPMTVTDFKCQRTTVATLVEITRLGHAWSGGATQRPFSDALGPDASGMVWAFSSKRF